MFILNHFFLFAIIINQWRQYHGVTCSYSTELFSHFCSSSFIDNDTTIHWQFDGLFFDTAWIPHECQWLVSMDHYGMCVRCWTIHWWEWCWSSTNFKKTSRLTCTALIQRFQYSIDFISGQSNALYPSIVQFDEYNHDVTGLRQNATGTESALNGLKLATSALNSSVKLCSQMFLHSETTVLCHGVTYNIDSCLKSNRYCFCYLYCISCAHSPYTYIFLLFYS